MSLDLDEPDVETPVWGWKVVVAVIFVFLQYVNYLRSKEPAIFRRHCTPLGWWFGFKKLRAYIEMRIYQRLIRLKKPVTSSFFEPSVDDERREQRRELKLLTTSDAVRIFALDQSGNSLTAAITHYTDRKELALQLRLADGSTYGLKGAPSNYIEVGADNVNKGWQVGGLRYQVVEAGKVFRLTFNGLLQNNSKTHHVRFQFIWSGCGGTINLTRDWNHRLLSDALARETWRKNEWKHLVTDQGRGFDQWGTMRGLVHIDRSSPLELNLTSLRQRRWGPPEADTLQIRAETVGFTESGLCFHLRVTSHPFGLTYARFGHVLFPNGDIAHVKDCDMALEEVPGQDSPLPTNVLLSLSAGGKSFEGILTAVSDTKTFGHRYLSRLAAVDLSLNGERGLGLVHIWYRDESKRGASANLKPLLLADSELQPLTVSLMDKRCLQPELVGGKATSLCFLSSLESTLFLVPSGFCITVKSYQNHLQHNLQLNNCIEDLKNTSPSLLADKCREIQNLFVEGTLGTELSSEIKSQLSLLTLPVAVRSSAVGEDGEDFSFAGQNATLLGLQSEGQVLSAVLQCWASIYSHTSLQYRIEHGLGLKAEMAVVVQEMVAAETAGVMFTQCPVTHDPRVVHIAANHGLGEGVVSGETETDCYEVLIKDNGDLSIEGVKHGYKQTKIVLSESGTKEVQVGDLEALEPCLTDQQVLKMVQCGRYVQLEYGSARDIEWAISDDKLYLLQARPITSEAAWTEFELLHELDEPVMSKVHITSTANTGEVFPGAPSTLCLSTVLKALTYDPKAVCTISHSHALLNLLKSTLVSPNSEIDLVTQILDLSVMGHPVTTPHMLELAKLRNGVSTTFSKIKAFAASIWAILMSGSSSKKAENLAKNFAVNVNKDENPEALLEAIRGKLMKLQEVMRYHCTTSRASATIQIILMSILADGAQELGEEHLFDLSLVMSGSRSVSSEIPAALDRLASLIIAEGKHQEFANSCSAADFLKTNSSASYSLLQRFLDQHGHRGWREFDYMTDVWGVDSSPVLDTLQNIVRQQANGHVTRQSTPISTAQLLQQLKTPLKPSQKWIIGKIMSLNQGAVERREKTKDSFIRLVHGLRKDYRHLGDMLYENHTLPRSSLVFHLTHNELVQLVRYGPSSVVVKASMRQRFWKKWDKLSFPEIMLGLPCTVSQYQEVLPTLSGSTLTGTAVCGGYVMGRAVVAYEIDDARVLQSGDILVTHSTDVGWCPYFPLLGGVITEIGGIISHGAVVAREYGLPCIVGVGNATKVLRTGDVIVMDARNGIIQKMDGVVEP